MGSSLLFSAIGVLAVILSASLSQADAFDTRDDIYDFLVQDVCTVAAPNGAMDPSRLPHECPRNNRRNMRPDDPFYYRTIGRVASTADKFAYGKFAWSSYPVIANDRRRILLLKDNGAFQPGERDQKFGVLDGGDGISIRWMDSLATGNAFMLFTVSPGGGGLGITEERCSRFAQTDIRRYHDNWTTAPKDIGSLPFDVVWGFSTRVSAILSINPTTFADVPEVLERRQALPDLSDCARLTFRNVFSLAVRTREFRFTNNVPMEAVVHQKSTPGSSANLGPTTSKAFERIYLTREYGVTRWEVWQRRDHPEFDATEVQGLKAAMTLATAPRGERVCTPPYDLARDSKANVNFSARSIGVDEIGYYQEYQDPSTGEGYQRFYLTACVDVSGRILSGSVLSSVYQGRQNFKPSIQSLIERFTDPEHRLMDLFF